MSEALRLYLDENVSDDIAAAFRRRGIDVLTAREAGNLGRPDAEQLAFATLEQRTVVTHDRGIRDTHWLHQPHAGVFFVPQRTPVSMAVEWLEMAARVLSAEEMADPLEAFRH